VGHVLSELVDSTASLLKTRRWMHWYTGEGIDEHELSDAHEVLIDMARHYNDVSVPRAGASVEVMCDGRWHRGRLEADGAAARVAMAHNGVVVDVEKPLQQMRPSAPPAGLQQAVWERGARQHLPLRVSEAIGNAVWRVWSCRTRP